MKTIDFQTVNDAELEHAVGGVGIGFIGPFAVLQGSNPAEAAALLDFGTKLGASLGPLSQALGLFHL